MSLQKCEQRIEYWRAQLLEERKRYEFLRDFHYFVIRGAYDSRYRVYLALEPYGTLTNAGQAKGFDTADEAVSAAMNGEQT